MASLQKKMYARLNALGFEWDRRNAKQVDYYVRGGMEIAVNPSASEVGMRLIMRTLDKLEGVDRSEGKRNPAQVRERQARERDQLSAEREQHQAKIAEIVAMKFLANYDVTSEEARKIDALIESWERRVREIDHLMKSLPAPLHNTVRHTAGSR